MDPGTILGLINTLATVAPAIKSMFSGGRSNQSSYGGGQQQMGRSNMGFQTQQMPGGGTAVQMPNFTPEQMNMMQQLGSQGMAGMGNLPSASFDPIQQAMTSQFYQNTVPGIKEQFTNIGGQRSSAFGQELGAAGAGLSERMAAMKQGFNVQQRGDEVQRLMQMMQYGLQPQFQYGITPPKQSFWSQAIPGLFSGVGSAIGGAAQYGAPLLQKYLGNKYPQTFGDQGYQGAK